jgi:flagellar basal-body rod modification protein FlgD
MSIVNSVAGTAATSSKSTSALGRNFNSFVNILAAQIRNQDPLAPMDTHQFTNQLVQFTQVEEMMALKESFGAISAQMSEANLMSAGQLVGKDITFKSPTVRLENGSADIFFSASPGVASVTATIKRNDGSVVRSLRSAASGGEGRLNWDGLDDRGRGLAEGAYNVEIQGRDTSGNPVAVTANARAKVTSVSRSGDGAISLSTSAGSVKFGDVVSFGTIS